MNPACVWVQDVEGYWSTACGQDFQFTEGGPEDNSFRFCYSCGRLLEAVKPPDLGFEAFCVEENEL